MFTTNQCENVHPVYGAGIRTHNLTNLSRHPKPPDQVLVWIPPIYLIKATKSKPNVGTWAVQWYFSYEIIIIIIMWIMSRKLLLCPTDDVVN